MRLAQRQQPVLPILLVRRQLARGLELLDDLQRLVDRPALLLAVGLNKMGDVKFFAGGDAQGAIAEYEESLVLTRALADKNQGNAQLQRDMSVSLDKIGDVKRSQNDNDQSVCESFGSQSRGRGASGRARHHR